MNEHIQKISTGISGLDEILHGGFIQGRSYLLSGGPGTGKTTIGFHFLTCEQNEKSSFITFGESIQQLETNAKILGFDLSNVNFLDFSPTSEFFTASKTYDIFSSSTVESEPFITSVVDEFQKTKPQRVFIDSMTHLKYISADVHQFRKLVYGFIRFLNELKATVLFTSESNSKAEDGDLRFLSDGVLELEMSQIERTISVPKFRGSDSKQGKHIFKIGNNGMEVYPRLVPGIYSRVFTKETISSGIPDLDELLHGGIERGCINIITGPTGVGKTSLGLQFMKEAAGRGEKSTIFTFEESNDLLITRSENINIPVRKMLEKGKLSLFQVEPIKYSPDEFAYLVRNEVEKQDVKIIMIDSSSGYKLSMKGEDIITHLHSICKYMVNMGVTVILINEVTNIIGDFLATGLGISYLADNIIFLRYYEYKGGLNKAIGVIKKRLTNFEKTIREFEITPYGIKVGRPLLNFQGLLSGIPIVNQDK